MTTLERVKAWLDLPAPGQGMAGGFGGSGEATWQPVGHPPTESWAVGPKWEGLYLPCAQGSMTLNSKLKTPWQVEGETAEERKVCFDTFNGIVLFCFLNKGPCSQFHLVQQRL